MRKLLATLVLGLGTTAAWAQSDVSRSRPGLLDSIVSTLIFGVIGIVLATVGFKLFDFVIKADIEKEIFENKNMAAALLAGAVVLGVSLIVAATIHS